jgi:hypothetical protein
MASNVNVKIMQTVLEYILRQEINIVKNNEKTESPDVKEIYKRFYNRIGIDLNSTLQQYEEYMSIKNKDNKGKIKTTLSKSWNGEIIVKTAVQLIKMEAKNTDTVLSIKSRVSEKESIATNIQRVLFKERQLSDDDMLGSCGITKGSTLNVILKLTEGISIYVKTLLGTTFKIEAEDNCLVANLKQAICTKEGLPSNNQILIYNGQILRDIQNIGFYGIGNNSKLLVSLKVLSKGNQLYAKLPGGKLTMLDVPVTESALAVKNIIQIKESIPISIQTLFYATKELDERTLMEQGVQKGDILEVNLKPFETKLIYQESEILDPSFDFDFSNLVDDGKVFRRGGRIYERPCGWKRIAFQVKNKYENETWLGSTNMVGEWPCAYHAANTDFTKFIGYDGFDLTKLKRLQNQKVHFLTPKFDTALSLATEITINGQVIKFLIKSRVNPEKIIERKDGVFWLVASDNIRPYGILYKTGK